MKVFVLCQEVDTGFLRQGYVEDEPVHIWDETWVTINGEEVYAKILRVCDYET